jgi:hypothetical protein
VDAQAVGAARAGGRGRHVEEHRRVAGPAGVPRSRSPRCWTRSKPAPTRSG